MDLSRLSSTRMVLIFKVPIKMVFFYICIEKNNELIDKGEKVEQAVRKTSLKIYYANGTEKSSVETMKYGIDLKLNNYHYASLQLKTNIEIALKVLQWDR